MSQLPLFKIAAQPRRNRNGWRNDQARSADTRSVVDLNVRRWQRSKRSRRLEQKRRAA